MLTHLFRMIASQWKSNCWILAELFLSFCCLWVVAYQLAVLLGRSVADTSFHIDHVYQAACETMPADAAGYNPESDLVDENQQLAARLRKLPGVEAVGFTDMYSYPYTASRRGNYVCRDTIAFADACYVGAMSVEALSVFRLQTADARIDIRKEVEREDLINLLSDKPMTKLFGEEVNVGRFHFLGMREDKNLGFRVVGNVAVNEYAADNAPFVWTVRREARFLKKNQGEGQLFFRVSPEADHDFINRFWKEMKGQLKVGNTMITNIIPCSTIRSQLLQLEGVDLLYTFAYLLGGFFLLCTFLGVIGTFWFRTEARTAEIGLRMALGSSRSEIRRLMMGEGLLLFAMAWVPGMIVLWLSRSWVNVVDYELPMAEPLFFLLITVVTTLLIGLLIVGGIWYPARQAAAVNPVEALHYE